MEPIDGPSGEHDDPHPVGWLREFEAGVGLLRRNSNPGCVQRRRSCQTPCRIHLRVVPVHHHDPRKKPNGEQDAKPYAQPAMAEDGVLASWMLVFDIIGIDKRSVVKTLIGDPG